MSRKETLKRILGYMKNDKFLLILSVLCSLLSSASALYLPFVFGSAIDVMHKEGFQIDFLISVLIKALIVITIQVITSLLMNLINNKITCNVSSLIRNKASEKINRLTISYLDSHSTGDTVSRIIYDVDKISDGLLMGLSQVFCGVVTVAGTIGFMFKISWQIALIVIVFTPISLLTARFISSRTFKMFKLQSEINGEITGFINETVGEQKTVRAFSGKDEADGLAFEEKNKRLKKAALSATFFSSLVNPTTRVINNIIYAIVAMIGCLLAIFTGGITVGGLTSLLAYASQYAKPFNDISGVITELESSIASAQRVFELLDAEELSDENSTELSSVNGYVDMKNVWFSYVKDKPLIEDFNLNVKPGMHVAFVGPTGCGKTTIINLLMRFYNVNSGIIEIDQTPIDSVTRNSVRKSFGMVLQDTWIKTGTVYENIRMGNPNATDDEVILAAKQAYADEFIRRLPNGYETVISTSSGLSEGEKQLLCISRLMLCRPPMLILDEATSSIDLLTEVNIRHAFNRVMEGKTSFVVAHRLSTIKDCDLIVVLKDGKIIEQGTHNELCLKKGLYSEMYNAGKGISQN